MQFTDSAASIVVLADFAPARFHPDWFVRVGLLPSDYLDDAEIAMVTPNSTVWKHPRVGEVTVLPDRMSIVCRDDAFWFMMRDVVEGVLSLDAGIVVKAIGFNYHSQCALTEGDARAEMWQALGDVFMPKDLWRVTLDLPADVGIAGAEGFKMSYPFDRERLPNSRRVFGIDAVLALPFTLTLLVNNHYDVASAVMPKHETTATMSQSSRQDLVRDLFEDKFESSLSTGRSEIERILRAAFSAARTACERRD